MSQYGLINNGLEYLFAFFSGLLSILSPCVLPMLPIIIASSMQAAPRYILFLPLGLASCFTLLGVSSNFIFTTFNLATFELQKIAAFIFLALGLILIFSAWADYSQRKSESFFQKLLQKIVAPLQNIIQGLNLKSAWGQFLLGFLLALTWSPCIGPTLGVALSLAASGENLMHAASIMFLYSFGISLPFALVIYLGKRFRFLQQTLQQKNMHFKMLFGILIALWGISVLMGWDKALSSSLLNSNINSFLGAQ